MGAPSEGLRPPESDGDGLLWAWLVLGLLPLLGRALFGAWSDAELGFAVVIVLFAARLLWIERRSARRRVALRAPPRPSYAQGVSPADAVPSFPSPQASLDDGPRVGAWTAYASTSALVALATGIGAATRDVVAAPDQVMLYLVAIGTAAAAFGRGPALLAALSSIATYNFFFVLPLYTFAVKDLRYLLTFAMMFAVGMLTSSAMHRIRRQAREARTEELRSSLLSAVSHDLRTPLAAITGAATTLRDDTGRLSRQEQLELLDAVCEEAERLERLVRNLLDMTRVQSGALPVEREWVPLEELVGAALGRVQSQLAGRAIGTRLPPELPLLSVDPVLLEQVLVNLLENAAKHTPAGSPVDIEARATEAAVMLEVADRGPGIAPAAAVRVFERFVRGADGNVPGSGLGLAICRGIVEAHGGVIDVRSRPGGGAVFRVSLPRRGAPPEVPEATGLAEPGGAPSR